MMINPSDTSTLSFQSDSPLSKLVEHCNKFAEPSSKKMVDVVGGSGVGGVKEVSPTDSLLLPADMASYASYQHFLPTSNWWVDQANWQLAYPAAAAAAASDAYHTYLTPLNGLLSTTTAATSCTTNSATTSATKTKKLSPESSSNSPNRATTAPVTPSTTGNGGGKYQSRSNCECPNCQETERVGVNNVAARKRGVHNCHIAGCGKVYNKSSHLKAHLRWHSGERPTKKRHGEPI